MLNSFFWMCSGADPDLLAESPKSERIKYAGIGGTVFFTAVMATIASSYALYTVFDDPWLAIFFGTVWGLLIFNLDRFIVSTLKKRDNKMDEMMQAMPRIILAVIIAVVIAKPMELKIFEKEIDQVLLEQKNEMRLADQEQVSALYAQARGRIEQETQVIDQQIARKKAEVDALYSTYIAEAEGTAGTNLLGKGPVYAEKRAKHDSQLALLNDMRAEGKERKAILSAELSDLALDEEEQLGVGTAIISNFDGLMARVNALGELPWMPSFFIFLLFLAIETSPILAKLLSPRGEYDIRSADAEEAMTVWAMQKKRQRTAMLVADTVINEKVYEAMQDEEETYHYKKQKARALLRFQSDAFSKGQEDVVKGLG